MFITYFKLSTEKHPPFDFNVYLIYIFQVQYICILNLPIQNCNVINFVGEVVDVSCPMLLAWYMYDHWIYTYIYILACSCYTSIGAAWVNEVVYIDGNQL